jgi:hypothetical protein
MPTTQAAAFTLPTAGGQPPQTPASGVQLYVSVLGECGFTPGQVRALMAMVITAAELNPARITRFDELFRRPGWRWTDAQTRGWFKDQLTKMAKNAVWWPPPWRRGGRLPRGNDKKILAALETGPKTQVQLRRKLRTVTAAEVNQLLVYMVKKAMIKRVKVNLYARLEGGAAAHTSLNRQIVRFIRSARDETTERDLNLAMAALGHTAMATLHSTDFLRANGILAPSERAHYARRSAERVVFSAESLAKMARGEVLCDGRGTRLWAPPAALPEEVTAWERRLSEIASAAAVTTLHLNRPPADPDEYVADIARLTGLSEEQCAAELEPAARRWGRPEQEILGLVKGQRAQRAEGSTALPQAVRGWVLSDPREEEAKQWFIEWMRKHPDCLPPGTTVRKLLEQAAARFGVSGRGARRTYDCALALTPTCKWSQNRRPRKIL